MPLAPGDPRITKEGHYTVWIYDEQDHLSNVLIAIARFRRRMPKGWPSSVQHHPDNIVPFTFGDDTTVGVDRAWLRDAIYLSTFQAWDYAHEGEREPTIFDGDRTPIEDDGFFFISREDLWE